MDEERIPLFSWLPQCRPAHGTKMRWRDRVRMEVFEKRQHSNWRGQCRAGLEDATEKIIDDEQRKAAARAAVETNDMPFKYRYLPTYFPEETGYLPAQMCHHWFERTSDD